MKLKTLIKHVIQKVANRLGYRILRLPTSGGPAAEQAGEADRLRTLWSHATPSSVSETAKCRGRLVSYCRGYGVDIGYGGDPIVPSAITVDMPMPYTKVGGHPLNLGGDARYLHWFNDNVLDYVFSSHLLEDFKDTEGVLREWTRVLKDGGYLILFCPDEAAYRQHCRSTGQPYNASHQHRDFGLAYVRQILLDRFPEMEIVHETPLVDVYSFELVARKRTPPTGGADRSR